MNETMTTFWGIAMPFLGTIIGAAAVFFLRKEMKPFIQKMLLGFASGVMIAASIWSLLLPAIDMAEKKGTPAWIPTVTGFLFGVLFLLLLNRLILKLQNRNEKKESELNKHQKIKMLILAVTLHNIPEGMAVGVVFAGALSGDKTITFAGAFAFAMGIAIQNFPEGSIISMPLASDGVKKRKAFGCGVLSGVVEPIGAVLTLILTSFIAPILPYILSFAAGAMIYVVVDELIPEAQEGKHSNVATIGAAVGFAIMMLLDVALG